MYFCNSRPVWAHPTLHDHKNTGSGAPPSTMGTLASPALLDASGNPRHWQWQCERKAPGADTTESPQSTANKQLLNQCMPATHPHCNIHHLLKEARSYPLICCKAVQALLSPGHSICPFVPGLQLLPLNRCPQDGMVGWCTMWLQVCSSLSKWFIWTSLQRQLWLFRMLYRKKYFPPTDLNVVQ